MGLKEIKNGIYYVGAQDWDRRLFDELIPLPDGTSYNSYIVKGNEKTALVDTVDPEMSDQLLENLEKLGVDRIDYIISNHAEQDHSGSIPDILEKFPNSIVVTNSKCKNLLMDLLLIPEEKFRVVQNREDLSLGNLTLEFMIAPWVHWPETMFTFCREERVLFSCDFLGSHMATSDIYVKDEARVYESAKRYYAEIMMPFRNLVKRHIKSVREKKPEIIAPSHGPVYREPEFILDAYEEWVMDESENLALIPFVSMHGSVKMMVEHLTNSLAEKGISVIPFNLTNADLGKIAINLVDASTIIIASPTVLAGAHPSVLYGTAVINALRPKLKYAGIIGSYGWAGKMEKQLQELIPKLKVELLDSVMIKGHPEEKDFKSLDKLADTIAQKHSNSENIKKPTKNTNRRRDRYD